MKGIGGVATPQYISCTPEGLKYLPYLLHMSGKINGGNRIWEDRGWGTRVK